MRTSEPKSIAIASLAAAIVPVAWFIGYQLLGQYPIVSDTISLVGLSFVVYWGAAVFAFASAYLSLSVFRRFAMVRWWTAAGAGAAWGVLFAIAYGNHPNSMAALVSWAAIGATCGLIFGAVWRYLDNRGKA